MKERFVKMEATAVACFVEKKEFFRIIVKKKCVNPNLGVEKRETKREML